MTEARPESECVTAVSAGRVPRGTLKALAAPSAGLWDWDPAQACPMGRAAPAMNPRLQPRVHGPPASHASA